MASTRPVMTFLLLAFGLSWSFWLALWALGLRVAPDSSTSHLPGLAGPAIAALVVTGLTQGRTGLADLARRCGRWPDHPGRVLALILLPLAVAALWFGWRAAMGDALPGRAEFTSYPGLTGGWQTLAGFGLVLVLNGFGEEIGWRGFLFDTLAQAASRFSTALAVAVVWAFWHAPIFLIHDGMAAMIGFTLLGWLAGLTLGSFALAHLYILSGRSLLAVSVWHVGFNLCTATPAMAGPVAAIVTVAVMVWGGAVAIVWALPARRGPA